MIRKDPEFWSRVTTSLRIFGVVLLGLLTGCSLIPAFQRDALRKLKHADGFESVWVVELQRTSVGGPSSIEVNRYEFTETEKGYSGRQARFQVSVGAVGSNGPGDIIWTDLTASEASTTRERLYAFDWETAKQQSADGLTVPFDEYAVIRAAFGGKTREIKGGVRSTPEILSLLADLGIIQASERVTSPSSQ